ncbi:MAG: hypothetical protein LWX56_02775 [Ignavibacteria bacterium]|nr:hypothetical protein [Ignavibacteria bacterium]
MRYRVLLVLFLSGLFFGFLPDDNKKLAKTMDDDNSKYTNVGNIGLTVSNYGVYGNGLRNLTQPNHPPSCEYPLGSGIEHIFVGGLWVGAYVKDNATSISKSGPFVTTGAIDASSLVSGRNGGFEFTNAAGAKIVERSTLIDSRYYNPFAISHQDLVSDYTDVNKTYSNGTQITDHEPLNINIHEENYCWNFPFADFFVIKNYTIKNVGQKYLDSVYVGLWTDAVVRNTKIYTSTNTAFFSKGGNGYLDNDTMKLAYEYDADVWGGACDSYIGIAYLGSTPEVKNFVVSGGDTLFASNFNAWTHSNSTDPNFFAPGNDLQRYTKMQGYFGGTNRYGRGINPADLKVKDQSIQSNKSMLITHGYYKNIAPGDSINVVFAIVCSNKSGNDPANLDNPDQRKELVSNADWAYRAYYGNDKNRDGKIDPKEDIFGDGKIHRFILPAPPTTPVLKVVPGKNTATIYWDKRAEASIDPIASEDKKRDFAGYKIYRTQPPFDLNLNQTLANSFELLLQADSSAATGFNTGFKKVMIDPTDANKYVTFDGDTNKYYYKYELKNLLNGWQYVFSVTAYDKGDPDNGLPPLESSLFANMKRIIPGTPAVNDNSTSIGVYPNPYYAKAIWDGNSERLRKIYFYNLPSSCEITIYTLAGDIVKRIHHDQTSNGSDTRWFSTYASDGKQQMAGGEHAWDLITGNDQAIATGLYLFTVKNNASGEIKKGKFLIVK